MAPVQSSKEVDPTTKSQLSSNGAAKKDSKPLGNSNQKALRCTSNFEDTMSEMEALLNEHTKAPDTPKDIEIDILERSTATTSDIRLAKRDDPDATEYSSSFGGTVSGGENYSGLSEVEVESGFCGDNGWEPSFDAFSSMFQMRKKKLTNHWRNFIRPLMWRCKWTELRIKEIEYQASKYATELLSYDQRKQLEIDQYMLESAGSKSLPFSNQHYPKRAMERRKRKRIETSMDLTSYMLNHNLFSYLEHKKSDPDGTSMADDFGNAVVTEQNANSNINFGINFDQSIFEFRDNDSSLELVLSKIDIVQSRIQKLKAKLEMVMSENAEKFSSSENLSVLVPCDLQTSAAHSPSFSAGNGDAISVGAICTQHMSECDIGDPFMPETAVSSYEEVFVPDMIESTVGLLSAIDDTPHQPQIGDSSEAILDSVIINDEPSEEKGQAFENVGNASTEQNVKPPTGELKESTVPVKPDALANTIVSQQQAAPSSRMPTELRFPKNKRRRVDRRAGLGSGWNQKQADGQG